MMTEVSRPGVWFLFETMFLCVALADLEVCIDQMASNLQISTASASRELRLKTVPPFLGPLWQLQLGSRKVAVGRVCRGLT